MGGNPPDAAYPPRVLIVEEDPSLRRMLRLLLAGEGVSVVEAASVTDALERVADPATKPDVLIADLVLVDAQEFNLLRQIRRHPAGSALPVVVLTGREAEELKSQALNAGADAFVTKPFTLRMLLDAVSPLIQEGRTRASAGRFSSECTNGRLSA